MCGPRLELPVRVACPLLTKDAKAVRRGDSQAKTTQGLATQENGEAMLDVIVWGSRGSVPVSGPRFIRHGGATTCIEISVPDAEGSTPQRIVVDCGTGLCELGKRWGDRPKEGLFLLSHLHWDHIQGFPFFAPWFDPAGRYSIMAVPRGGDTAPVVLRRQMTAPTFPVGLEIIPARIEFQDLVSCGSACLGDLRLTWRELVHPFGNTAYRLDYGGASVVVSGDNEIRAGGRDSLLSLAAGAGLLIMDSQYLPEEYPNRVGFGHATVVDAVEVALEANVTRLLLTHHDPTHDDVELARKLAIGRAAAAGTSLIVDSAYDQLATSVAPSRAAGHERGGSRHAPSLAPVSL